MTKKLSEDQIRKDIQNTDIKESIQNARDALEKAMNPGREGLGEIAYMAKALNGIMYEMLHYLRTYELDPSYIAQKTEGINDAANNLFKQQCNKPAKHL